MRIAIPSETDEGLNGFVAEHFGRAPYYVIVDIEEGKIVKVQVEKTPSTEHVFGLIPRFLKERKVDLIIAMRMGPRARELFRQLGIRVITGASGRIIDLINELKREITKIQE